MAGAAVLRVRRKRGGPEPAEALLLACKRRRAEPVGTDLFKLAATVSSKVLGRAGRGGAGRPGLLEGVGKQRLSLAAPGGALGLPCGCGGLESGPEQRRPVPGTEGPARRLLLRCDSATGRSTVASAMSWAQHSLFYT